jgi:predicted NUDIX family phosphoesterase
LNDYDLQIGFNINIIVDAGKKIERKIEIIDYNSLTFINLINEENENMNEININLLKLDIEKNEWNNVELKENSNKIILFCEEPSMYKLIFDNSKAWIKKKKVIYSLIFLKPFQIKE